MPRLSAAALASLPVLLALYPACSRPADETPFPAPIESEPVLGRAGGRLVVALRSDPGSLNPLVAADNVSLTALRRMHADLVHINRYTQKTEPALAESWSFSEDGRAITAHLRRGLRFSDGEPCDADDVLFSFRAYLDESFGFLGRDLLVIGGEPITVRKVDTHTVVFEMAEPNAVGERLFDSLAILPEHLLRRPFEEGRLAEVWSTGSGPSEIAGLGPFRLKEYVPAQRLVLERNPHYWKVDAAGQQLPYLDELVFIFVASQDAQAIRFQSGETDVIDDLSAENFAVLERGTAKGGYRLFDLGPGLAYHFLFFNLNDLADRDLAAVESKQQWFNDREFRRALSEAIDREAIANLVFKGRAEPLGTSVSSGNKLWRSEAIGPPVHSPGSARRRLSDAGYSWSDDGRLLAPDRKPVTFTIVTNSSNTQRVRMGTLIQEDLDRLGIGVQVVPIEFRALLDRVLRSFDYEASILALEPGDVDPNTDLNVWLSDGGSHLWRLAGAKPANAAEAEIDRLLREQLAELDPAARKAKYDRVQEIIAETVPVIFLVSHDILVGAKVGLGNFRPAVLDHSTLWNVEELFWQAAEPDGGGEAAPLDRATRKP